MSIENFFPSEKKTKNKNSKKPCMKPLCTFVEIMKSLGDFILSVRLNIPQLKFRKRNKRKEKKKLRGGKKTTNEDSKKPCMKPLCNFVEIMITLALGRFCSISRFKHTPIEKFRREIKEKKKKKDSTKLKKKKMGGIECKAKPKDQKWPMIPK